MQPITTDDGLFKAGDPFNNIQGTAVTAAWLNAVQGELLAIIVAAGLQPAAQLQLLTALNTRFATLESPSLTGTPKAPTPAAGDSSTKVATTAFAQALFAALAQTVSNGDTALQNGINTKPSHVKLFFIATS